MQFVVHSEVTMAVAVRGCGPVSSGRYTGWFRKKG